MQEDDQRLRLLWRMAQRLSRQVGLAVKARPLGGPGRRLAVKTESLWRLILRLVA